ncbi:hypothetical protein [Neptunicoccus sediminis]|uniref:hypothetical protein n=1 Tax=Neptunicoccus sediminis TaxID=1892596 RepID=UPI000845F845|nr:hypothetical protein [Neptunicoccus sediminis]
MSLKSNFTSAQTVSVVDYTGSTRADVGQVLNGLVQTPDLPAAVSKEIHKMTTGAALADLCARASVVVFWRAAEFAVSDALSAGIPLDQAIEGWKTAQQDLLGICRKHRQSVVLMDFDRFTTAPADFAAELAAQTGLGFKGTNEPAEFHVDPLYRAIAALQTLRSLPVTRMVGELEASSVRPADHVAPDDDNNRRAELALTHYQKMLDQEKTAGREQALQQDQIVAVQEELETSHRRMKELEAEAKAEKDEFELVNLAKSEQSSLNELLTVQIRNLQKELADSHVASLEHAKTHRDYEAQLKEAHDKNLTQQAELEESHGHYERRLSDQQNELAERDRHIGVLEQELAESRDMVTQLLGSTSWRVTGPIRKVKDSLKGRG